RWGFPKQGEFVSVMQVLSRGQDSHNRETVTMSTTTLLHLPPATTKLTWLTIGRCFVSKSHLPMLFVCKVIYALKAWRQSKSQHRSMPLLLITALTWMQPSFQPFYRSTAHRSWVSNTCWLTFIMSG